MKKKILRVAGVLTVVFLIGPGAFSCTIQQIEEEAGKQEIGVVVSILPQAEFVEKLGGDKVKVIVMIPPGASPHTYEPTPGQLKEVSKSRIYAKVGSGVEFELAWMDKIIGVNKEMIVIDCSKDADIIEGDLHIWLSPKNAKIMVENIYKGLVKIDFKNQEYYRNNKEKYLQELDELDDKISNILSGKKDRKIMVYHPAWAYFARDYNLKQIPIEKEGKEPTTEGIKILIEQAKGSNINVIFASPEFSTESAEVIAKEIGGAVVLINPLEKNYLENMYKVAKAFAEVLK